MPRLFIIFSFFLSSSLLADEIHTKNGSYHRGEIIAMDERKIRLNLGCGQFSVIRLEDIREHVKEPLEQILLYLGKRELARHQIRRATRTLTRASEASPKNLEIQIALTKAQVQLAGKELERKHPVKALALLENALKILPKDPEILSFSKKINDTILFIDNLEKTALTFHVQGKWLNAYNAFQKLLRHDLSRGQNIRKPYAETLVSLGDKELLDKQWVLARDYYNEALKQEPDIIQLIEQRWVTSHLEPIRELLDRRNTQMALDEINHVLSVAPENINALYYRAAAFVQLENIDKANEDFIKILIQQGHEEIPEDLETLEKEARKHYTSSFTILPLDQLEKRWQKSLPGDWKDIEGPGWILHHHSDWIARQIQLTIDDSLARITYELTGKNIVPHFDPPLEIYIYRNEKDFFETAKISGWAAGVTRIRQLNKKVVSRQILSYQTSPQLVRSTIPHELVHVLLPIFLDNSTEIPEWLNEGVASRFEPDFKKGFYKNLVAQHAASGSQIPLKDLVSQETYPENEEDVKLFYAESYLLVNYLIETHGAAEFLNWAKTVTETNAQEKLESWIGPLDLLEESLFGP